MNDSPEPALRSLWGRLCARGAPLPRSMASVVIVAFVATASVTLLAAELRDDTQIAADERAHHEERTRDELIALGFQELAVTNAPVALLEPGRRFTIDGGNGELIGVPAPRDQRDRAAMIVSRELGKYARSFLDRIELRRVLLCKELREGGRPIPSLPNLQHSLLLDVNAPEAELIHLIHHEVFHFADYADDFQLQKDTAWESFNGAWFVYGSGGRSMREAGSGRWSDEHPGFVTRYAMSALEEDKAELFAFMMTAPKVVAQRAEHDPVVRRKLAYLNRQLSALDVRVPTAAPAR